jgi:hypothetical protein
MITLDPDTAAPNPQILRKVNQAHEGAAGLYGAVLAEGVIGVTGRFVQNSTLTRGSLVIAFRTGSEMKEGFERKSPNIRRLVHDRGHIASAAISISLASSGFIAPL